MLPQTLGAEDIALACQALLRWHATLRQVRQPNHRKIGDGNAIAVHVRLICTAYRPAVIMLVQVLT